MIITRNTLFTLLERPDILNQIPELGFLVAEYRQTKAGKPTGCSACNKARGKNVDLSARGLTAIAGLAPERIGRLRSMLGDQKLYLYQGQPPVLQELGI